MKTCTKLIAIWLLTVSSPVFAAMEDDPTLASFIFNQFETGNSSENTLLGDMDAWIGKDLHKLWLKSEFEIADGELEESSVQLFYSRGFARYWDVQFGVRQDFDPSPRRSWAAIGLQGLAPYFFETDLTLFAGENGRTAFSFEFERELLFTQRLILTPEIEGIVYGKDDPAIGVGSGLSKVDYRLRLRYEIRREFAPYIGITWSRKYGDTADFARINGQSSGSTQLTLGLRVWL